MIAKMLTIECLETGCHFSHETDDSQDDWDEWVEKENCPRCEKRILEAI